ncbi:hypothetical protein QJS10_CPB13g01556 [Acorus calamus]|uniref:Uncharacterized protein n=1 Tax=Acorus calamus TaxID=4465 RepID=A0AAV9DGF8_ACOCL|nr:hypothetical protein QJS10_CPB13g01556 [Acorus calamus]
MAAPEERSSPATPSLPLGAPPSTSDQPSSPKPPPPPRGGTIDSIFNAFKVKSRALGVNPSSPSVSFKNRATPKPIPATSVSTHAITNAAPKPNPISTSTVTNSSLPTNPSPPSGAHTVTNTKAPKSHQIPSLLFPLESSNRKRCKFPGLFFSSDSLLGLPISNGQTSSKCGIVALHCSNLRRHRHNGSSQT